ncbi:MAG: acyl CoA:acetate/3-ketoacid CoA transferase alpha subunit [Sneathiella sp.]|jgi:acyl CoA:acetate/3-ketoacid CoA transferase alpha subunit
MVMLTFIGALLNRIRLSALGIVLIIFRSVTGKTVCHYQQNRFRRHQIIDGFPLIFRSPCAHTTSAVKSTSDR